MLNINTDTIVDILDKSRQFQAKEEVTFPEVTDDMDANYVLADYKDDAVFQDVVQSIDNLRPDQQAILVALMYLGRGDYSKCEWKDALEIATQELTPHTGEYLLSRPTMPDDIERGLDILEIPYKRSREI